MNNENLSIEEALDIIGYLIHKLPKLMYYASTTSYEEAYNVIYNYIKHQQLLEDDLK